MISRITKEVCMYSTNVIDKDIQKKIDGIRSMLYCRYKKEWREDHVSEKARKELYEKWQGLSDEDSLYYDEDDARYYDTFEKYEEEVGYGGEVYVCYDEFIDYEYQDRGWLRRHSSDEELKFLCDNDPMLNFTFDDVIYL